MFGSIGITEIIIMAGIGLVVMGPEKFPDFARTVARMVRDVRGYVADAQRDLEREMRPVKKELDALSKIDPETYIDQLAKSAMGDDEADNEEDKDDDSYNPEPEGPIVDGTQQYGESESSSEDQATEDSSAGDTSGESTEQTGRMPGAPDDEELYRD